MAAVQSVLLLVVAVALLVWAVLVVRSRDPRPWRGIGAAALTCAICFTVGGATGRDLSGPDPATIGAALCGVLCVVSATLALVPRGPRRPARLPVVVAVLGILVGAAGLLVNQLAG